MVKPVFYFLFYQVLQYFHVHHIARFRVDLSADAYREVVIVAVVIGQVAFAENGIILFI